MTADWNNGKKERAAYWKELQAEEVELQAAEEENERLQRHVRQIEADVMERSDIVSSVLTKKVKANAKSTVASLRSLDGSAVAPIKTRKYQPIDNIVKRPIAEQCEEEFQEEEEIEDDDDDGIGYSMADLYESDDLLHLDRLGEQLHDDRVTDENSDDDREGDVVNGADDRENPLCSRKKRKTMKCRGWPEVPISAEMSAYIESFADVDTLAGLKNSLSVRPEGLEEQLVYRCLEDWYVATSFFNLTQN
ncbi:hypothetical protein BG005_003765 [Podila minutissima]|nr:hypothetical protein BG005_003765 [Podila minutissima]